MVISFQWRGGDTAGAMLENGASGAVVSALTPICVDKLQRQAHVTTNLIELEKINSWQQVSKMPAGPERLRVNRPSLGPARRCSAI